MYVLQKSYFSPTNWLYTSAWHENYDNSTQYLIRIRHKLKLYIVILTPDYSKKVVNTILGYLGSYFCKKKKQKKQATKRDGNVFQFQNVIQQY